MKHSRSTGRTTNPQNPGGNVYPFNLEFLHLTENSDSSVATIHCPDLSIEIRQFKKRRQFVTEGAGGTGVSYITDISSQGLGTSKEYGKTLGEEGGFIVSQIGLRHIRTSRVPLHRRNRGGPRHPPLS